MNLFKLSIALVTTTKYIIIKWKKHTKKLTLKRTDCIVEKTSQSVQKLSLTHKPKCKTTGKKLRIDMNLRVIVQSCGRPIQYTAQNSYR